MYLYLNKLNNIKRTIYDSVIPKIQINIGKPFKPTAIPKNRLKRNKAIKVTGEEIMCRIAALMPDKYHGVYANDERVNSYRLNELSKN